METARPRRRTLVLGFVAAMVPLAVLLGLQFVWLSRLAQTTAIAHRAALRHFVEAVGGEVRFFYRTGAERALSMPASVLTDGNLREDAARYWATHRIEGAKRLFLVDYTKEMYGNFYVFDPDAEELRVPYASDESLAMIAACNPWQTIRYWGSREQNTIPLADERNPEFRIVLRPILDLRGQVLGVTGMILDEGYFREMLLPGTVERLIEDFFTDGSALHVVIRVRDENGNPVYSSASREGKDAVRALQKPPPGEDVPLDEVATPFSFVFSGWTVGLSSLGRGPEDVARESFLFNMSIAGVLTLVLAGGMLLALRAANRAMALTEMKADFVSNVSHELRTPVSSIRVFGEFLKTGRASDAQTVRRYGRHIEAEGRRLSRLIDNVLDFSRIESGRKEYEFVDARLEEVVETAVETFQVRLRDSGFDVAYSPPAAPLPAVRMDPDAIGQVVHNLLDNAVKYSGDSRRVEVTLGADGASVTCEVRDHGIGIPKGDQAKVFDRFHRVGNSLVHDVQGSGLGLSIVQHVVEAHRGDVNVESEPGEGTTV
ncbi:MAG TPA: ATP-binding protein, partial [bacterium]|nr:ATP-binding protein [bacterium]